MTERPNLSGVCAHRSDDYRPCEVCGLGLTRWERIVKWVRKLLASDEIGAVDGSG